MKSAAPKRKSEEEHSSLIQRSTGFLREKNYSEIRADLPQQQHSPPASITWASTGLSAAGEITPDITAEGESFSLFEVETGDSIFHRHTAEEWTLFSKFAEKNEAVFTIIVPEGSREAAERRLRALKLKAEVWEL